MITSAGYWLLVALGVPLYWALPERRRDVFLSLASLALLALADGRAAALFFVWAIVFYAAAPIAAKGRVRGLVPGAILLALGVLGFYKYAPPLLERILGPGPALDIAVPVGLSYFTFKLIHYVVEVARRNVAQHSFWRFLTWVFLFPTFTAGPIERIDHFLANTAERFDRSMLIEGSTRVIVGLVKKFVIADLLITEIMNKAVDPVDLTTGLGAWRVCITTFVMVYLDFSAYSDIAIGTSRLFGIRIMENFDWPILSVNIGEFWKRWHMTLVGWCRTYVYMPTIGLTRNPYLSVYALCLAVGLWHDASPSYVLWGLYHATGVVVFQTWKRSKMRKRLALPETGAWRVLGIVPTVLFVASSFCFTGRPVDEAFRMLARLVFLPVGDSI